MKGFGRRIGKLEERFGVSSVRKRTLVIVSAAATKLALSDDACVQILDQHGFLPACGWALVHLRAIPKGLNASETESFLRTEGAKICGPQRP